MQTFLDAKPIAQEKMIAVARPHRATQTPPAHQALTVRRVLVFTAERIRVVLDNLSTHSAGVLNQAFPAPEARRVPRRLEFHYVPKHASWLNMVEIEIGVLPSQYLGRRIATRTRLIPGIASWERQRNASRARINWMFTTEKARAKMARADPTDAKSTKESNHGAAIPARRGH
jgi:hypothetical protein